MTNAVTVSVVIPLYNAAGVIRETIETVLAQTWADREIVVVDDGSTDGSAEIVTQFGDRIRYAAFENGGVAKARNRGIALSLGRYVALLDHDDLWHPTKLAKQVAVLDARPEVGLVVTGVAHMRADGSRVESPRGPSGRFYDLFVKGFGPTPSAAMIRRTALEQAGGFDERFGSAGMDDHELWPRIADVCEIVMIDEPLTVHRYFEKKPAEVGLRHRGLLNELLLERYGHDPDKRRYLMEERAAYLADLGKWHVQRGERSQGRIYLQEALGLVLKEVPNGKTLWRAASRLLRSFL
jgi:glycosyltransferase involved in cell wall biosynthesis